MASNKMRIWLIAALLLGCLLSQAVPSESGCETNTITGSASAMKLYVTKSLNMIVYTCSLTMFMNVDICAGSPPTFGNTVMTSRIDASAFTSSISPSCGWNCGACGTVTIDGSDGLPVELMGFEVEDEGSGEEE